MVKVKLGVNGGTIECEAYDWGDNGITLYNATYDGSTWEQVEILNKSTILVFKGETKVEPVW